MGVEGEGSDPGRAEGASFGPPGCPAGPGRPKQPDPCAARSRLPAPAGPMYTQVAQGTFTGSYSFSGLAPGSYRVVFDGAAGYQRSPTGAGTDGTVDSDAGQTDGASGCFSLVSGQQKTDIDAGYYQRVFPSPLPPLPLCGRWWFYRSAIRPLRFF